MQIRAQSHPITRSAGDGARVPMVHRVLRSKWTKESGYFRKKCTFSIRVASARAAGRVQLRGYLKIEFTQNNEFVGRTFDCFVEEFKPSTL
jgi:hypothetical protein